MNPLRHEARLGAALPLLRLRLLGRDRLPLDVTGAVSVALVMRNGISAAPLATLSGALEGSEAVFPGPGASVAEPGLYQASVELAYPDGKKAILPGDPARGIEILVSSATQTFENLKLWHEGLRALLGDHEFPRMYADEVLDGGLRTVIRMGLVPGYALTPDVQAITPHPATPKDYGLILLKTALVFAENRPSRAAIRSRAVGESVGSYGELCRSLREKIAVLNGDTEGMGEMWQSLWAVRAGLHGRSLWETLTEVRITAPMNTLTLG